MKKETSILINKTPKRPYKKGDLLIDTRVIDDIYNQTNDFSIVGLYCRLLANQQENGLYYGNQNDLAKICNISKTTLNKGLKELKKLGYIKMKRQKNTDTIYIVYMEKQKGAN